MIKISREQRDFLLSHGAEYKKDIHRSGNHHNRAYYITCSPKMLDRLYKYYNEKIIEKR